MCLKELVTAAFGSSEPFYMGKWACHVGAIPTQGVYRLSDIICLLLPTTIFGSLLQGKGWCG